MKYTLRGYNIYELGKRKNQEDYIFPKYNQIRDTDRLFILCDGMGGHDCGEVASEAVCSTMSELVLTHCPDAEGKFSDQLLKDALSAAFDALDAKDNGGEKKMGTTMTFLKLHSEGATIAHIGDSRVYHLRPGKDQDSTKILFQTEDHSLVNDLVRIGEMTREEAKKSSQKNVITRAMQPRMERRSKADIYHTSDILPGDYFFLCSDGILEQMEDDNMRYIFSEASGDEEKKVELLKKVTSQNSDNHSAIMVHVLQVEGCPACEEKAEEVCEPSVSSATSDFEAVVEEKVPEKPCCPQPKEEKTVQKSEPKNHLEKEKKSTGRKYVWLFIVFALICFCAYWFFNYYRVSQKVAPRQDKKEVVAPAKKVTDPAAKEMGAPAKVEKAQPVQAEKVQSAKAAKAQLVKEK